MISLDKAFKSYRHLNFQICITIIHLPKITQFPSRLQTINKLLHAQSFRTLPCIICNLPNSVAVQEIVSTGVWIKLGGYCTTEHNGIRASGCVVLRLGSNCIQINDWVLYSYHNSPENSLEPRTIIAPVWGGKLFDCSAPFCEFERSFNFSSRRPAIMTFDPMNIVDDV